MKHGTTTHGISLWPVPYHNIFNNMILQLGMYLKLVWLELFSILFILNSKRCVLYLHTDVFYMLLGMYIVGYCVTNLVVVYSTWLAEYVVRDPQSKQEGTHYYLHTHMNTYLKPYHWLIKITKYHNMLML